TRVLRRSSAKIRVERSSDMATEPVLVRRDGAIATVTLNKPERLNALDKAMWRCLGEAMRELSADEGLRCIVLRGDGDRAFAAGADISESAPERAAPRLGAEYGALVHETMQSVGRSLPPTVALIQGACIGGGLEIASMCDIRICGEASRF